MIIRVFRDEDESQVVALWNEVLPGSAKHHDPSTSIRRKRNFQRELFFVATVSTTIVGTAMGGYDGHRGWIYSVAVSSLSRRQGVGTALIRQVEQALASLGCPKINLQILTQNSSVVAFYENLGYTVEPRVSMGKLMD